MTNKRRNIFKIADTRFKNKKWNLTLSYRKAIELNEVVALFDSQMFRLIEQIRGREIQAHEEVLAITFSHKADFMRAARKGVMLNGVLFKRFVGTTGGLKNYTILFVNAEIIDELNRRCECGRNTEVKIVPAKYEAYKALTASASVQIPNPKGILVVSDAMTHYKSDIIKLEGEPGELPLIENITNFLMENTATDGMNLCTPEYMQKIADSLGLDYMPSGVCLRMAWTKGMMVPFPIKEFIDKYKDCLEDYCVKDIWGNKIDVREVEMILTESSLKLWKCYDGINDFLDKAYSCGYNFSITKITPKVLEDNRELNYQYLQSYELSDEDIELLCKPTVDYLKNSLCGDYESTLEFLGLNNSTQQFIDWKQGLALNSELLRDKYVSNKIKTLIAKKISNAKIGKLKCNGNYQTVIGDPYLLMEHIFGLPEKGLLASREIYSKYWEDKGVEEVVIFRSPMTSHHNIRRVKIKNNEEVNKWFRYIKEMTIINGFDDLMVALNGMDFDGDSVYTTDNAILLSKYRELPCILCVQQSAEKKIITEEEIIESNWKGCGITVGAITNRATAQFDKLQEFQKGSPQYEEIYNRIIHSQNFQQNSIDSVKGIEFTPMPSSWYSLRNCETPEEKELCVSKKPYFMIYRYGELKKEYNKFRANANINAIKQFEKTLEELLSEDFVTEEEQTFLYYYYKKLPVSLAPSTMNRICWHIEKEIKEHYEWLREQKVDYSQFRYLGTSASKEMEELISDLIKLHYGSKIQMGKVLEQISKEDKWQKSAALREYCHDTLILLHKDKQVLNTLIKLTKKNERAKVFLWDCVPELIVKRLEELQ